jgi:Tfp pilus assembly PilM family ATPase
MSILSSLRQASAPSVAIEIAANRVSAAAVEDRGGHVVVSASAIEALPDGALVPALTTANTHDRPAVVGTLSRVLDRIGGRPRRVALVVPDVVAKVSLVRFEQVPARPQDLDQLVRWQVRKTAPFAITDAQVSYVPGFRAPEGQEFIVSIARRDIVQEYEGLCAEVGAHAGIVDLATFSVLNAILAASPPRAVDWLLINVTGSYASIAILRGEHVIFFRNRAADADGTLSDLVHQTAMYYEDRLGGRGFDRVMLTGGASGTPRDTAEFERARRSLEDRLGRQVEPVDPRNAAALTDRISAGPALLEALAPLVGLLLRDREVKVGR